MSKDGSWTLTTCSLHHIYATSNTPQLTLHLRWQPSPPSCTRQGDAIAQSPYWMRLWVAQELALSDHKVLLGDHNFVDLHDFECLLAHIEARAQWKPMANLLAYLPKGKQRVPLHLLLRYFGNRQCLDHRDRIYGLISLAERSSDVADIVVDYTISPETLSRRILAAWTGADSSTVNLLDDAWGLYDAILPSWQAATKQNATKQNATMYSERYATSLRRYAGLSLRAASHNGTSALPLDSDLRVRIRSRFTFMVHEESVSVKSVPKIVCARIENHPSRMALFAPVRVGDLVLEMGLLGKHGFVALYPVGRPCKDKLMILGFGATYHRAYLPDQWLIEKRLDQPPDLLLDNYDLMAMLWWCRQARDPETRCNIPTWDLRRKKRPVSRRR